MKTKVFSSLVGIAVASSALTLLAQRATTDGKAPELTVDREPLARQTTPNVTSYADVIEPVQAAVVSVHSMRMAREIGPADPFLRQFFGQRIPKQEGLGSGVIVTADGYIMTNNHVIDGADELRVLLPDGREFPAKVVGTDPKTDVAIIRIDADGLPTVTLADSDTIRVGDVVFAVGNPLGIGQTVTMGIVSAKSRSVGILESVGGYEDFIQTDASINQGNSGGALVDAQGRLIGINSAILSPNQGNIGIGFAIPINLASGIMRSLIETGTVTRGFLGVSVDPITTELADALGVDRGIRGMVVTDVVEGAPADKAGLRRSDVILSVNGRPVSSLQELRLLVSQLAPGSQVDLELIRDKERMNLAVKLEAIPDAVSAILPGIETVPLGPENRREYRIPNSIEGLLVTGVEPRSDFSNAFAPGMVIVEINGEAVTDLAGARQALRAGRRNLLYIYYRGVVRSLVVALP